MRAVPEEELEREAALFTRYLVAREPLPELNARYAAASRTLFARVAPGREEAVLAFVRRHPWSVGALDAAAGLRSPGGLLRGKILLMAAILETSAGLADDFLPRPVRPLRFFLTLVGRGMLATGRAAIGLPLWAMLARARA